MEKLKQFMDLYFISVLKEHYVDFEGRTGRYCYAGFVLVNICLSLIALLLDNILGIGILSGLLSLALLLPGLGINVRRMHDLGKSGWFVLIALIPLVGGLILLYMGIFMQGEQMENQYGPVPEDKKF